MVTQLPGVCTTQGSCRSACAEVKAEVAAALAEGLSSPCSGRHPPESATRGAAVKVASRTCPQQIARGHVLVFCFCYVISPTAAL